jgi:L-lactate utilization protein LutB
MKELINNLEKRKIDAYYVQNKEQACNKVMELIKSGESVGWGGSITLQECNILESLKSRTDIKLYDRDSVDEPKEREKILHDCLNVDVFLTSANAILNDGRIINIDGRGNRVAPTIYGPRKVIFIIGKNKIVDGDLEAGIKRVKNIASPPNTKRLNKTTTGCYLTGKCTDCSSPDRICRSIGIIEWGKNPGYELHVILVDENLGY